MADILEFSKKDAIPEGLACEAPTAPRCGSDCVASRLELEHEIMMLRHTICEMAIELVAARGMRTA